MTESDDYMLALQEADPQAATAAMHAALRRGATPEQWIRNVVVPAQQTVGDRWFDGTWSIADEHAATAVAEQAVTLLRPPDEAAPVTLDVVFACAEGEWHTFPARLAAELSGTAGVRAVFLGASVPPQHLARRLAASAPDVLALSCTMATNLIGAWRSINAAHDLGIPVAVGGRAWGTDNLRAHALGADVRLEDPAALATTRFNGVAEPVQLPAEALLLEAPSPELLELVLERQTAATPWLQGISDYQRHKGLTSLATLASHTAAAVAARDARILAELVDWMIGRHTQGGAPLDVLIDSCHYLADAIEPEAPLAADLLRTEGDAARRRHGDVTDLASR